MNSICYKAIKWQWWWWEMEMVDENGIYRCNGYTKYVQSFIIISGDTRFFHVRITEYINQSSRISFANWFQNTYTFQIIWPAKSVR